MQDAKSWWESKPRNKKWSDMNIPEKQKVIRAYYDVQLEPIRENLAFEHDEELWDSWDKEQRLRRLESIGIYPYDNEFANYDWSSLPDEIKMRLEANEAFEEEQIPTHSYVIENENLLFDIYNNADTTTKAAESLYNQSIGIAQEFGQGRRGHEPWMKQFEYGGNIRICPNCTIYTDHSGGACEICGTREKLIERKENFESNSNWENKKQINEVLSLPSSHTCLQCGMYFDEPLELTNHTC